MENICVKRAGETGKVQVKVQMIIRSWNEMWNVEWRKILVVFFNVLEQKRHNSSLTKMDY